jgi:hypothetical protein
MFFDDFIISIREEAWAYATALIPPQLFIEVSVPS